MSKKLSLSDFNLLFYALDILACDYQPDSIYKDALERRMRSMQKRIAKVQNKLIELEREILLTKKSKTK